jgi:hypothetical protein
MRPLWVAEHRHDSLDKAASAEARERQLNVHSTAAPHPRTTSVQLASPDRRQRVEITFVPGMSAFESRLAQDARRPSTCNSLWLSIVGSLRGRRCRKRRQRHHGERSRPRNDALDNIGAESGSLSPHAQDLSQIEMKYSKAKTSIRPSASPAWSAKPPCDASRPPINPATPRRRAASVRKKEPLMIEVLARRARDLAELSNGELPPLRG